MDKCPKCDGKMHEVYFGQEGRYKNIQYKRCINCNHIEPQKKEEQK